MAVFTPVLFPELSDMQKNALLSVPYRTGTLPNWSSPEIIQTADLYYRRTDANSLITFIQESADDEDFVLNVPMTNIEKAHAEIDKELGLEKNRDEGVVLAEGIKCRKCHGSKIFLTLKQTRGGDEPTSAFYRCADGACNNTWRVG